MLKIEKLTKSFEGVSAPILCDLDLSVNNGDSVSIQGASGCGKSTLLSLIAGFDTPSSGIILINDYCLYKSSKSSFQDVHSNARKLTAAEKGTFGTETVLNSVVRNRSYVDDFRKNHLGIVFQSYNLFDCFNAWDNIAFTARLKGNYNPQYQTELMEQLSILPLAKKPISQLSGGEQQRCAIARALVHKPSLILADEPTGNLDEATSQAVSDILYDICSAMNTTLLVVTHSPDVAKKANFPLWLHKGKLNKEKSPIKELQ
ncbi:ABC transporter ATP-binding protein [Alteromonas sp. BMJM2]|uniref:ABC transporter ATP-binding protein n=1 Tax=Alteromonas sp. BMJM2 TaxID=2954241 RepID=UPI0022B484DA|nr:ABC transporter ATP-binding protein [Alteromonas sp. BMJM2]